MKSTICIFSYAACLVVLASGCKFKNSASRSHGDDESSVSPDSEADGKANSELLGYVISFKCVVSWTIKAYHADRSREFDRSFEYKTYEPVDWGYFWSTSGEFKIDTANNVSYHKAWKLRCDNPRDCRLAASKSCRDEGTHQWRYMVHASYATLSHKGRIDLLTTNVETGETLYDTEDYGERKTSVANGRGSLRLAVMEYTGEFYQRSLIDLGELLR